ncbi:MAG: stage II sporulation protein D [Clostridia bacterium]|nr:stage II sporulation protein D [Clostridia bacterium]
MKKVLKFCTFAVILFFLPMIVALPFGFIEGIAFEDEEIDIWKREKVIVTVLDKGEYIEKDVEEHLLGVLIGEMPVSYEMEALKAQAVAGRTYIYRKIGTNPVSHPEADLCTNPSCCMAYTDVESVDEKSLEKIRRAVDETAGEYLVYENEIASAFFYACSSGKTENSEDVWGEEVPYLRSVESQGDNNNPKLIEEKTYTPQQLKSALGVNSIEIGGITYTEGGSVKNIKIGGKTFKGTEIRSLLGLRSACFTISKNNKNYIIITKGNGHGVGMSQFGANEMAKTGSNYEEILHHYFSGCILDKNL